MNFTHTNICIVLMKLNIHKILLILLCSDQVNAQSKQSHRKVRASDNIVDQEQQSVPHYTGL